METTNPPFKILDEIRLGWAKTKEHSGIIMPVATILVALAIPAYIFMPRDGVHMLLMGAASLIIGLVSAALWLGALSIAAALLEGRPASVRNIIPSAGTTKTYFWALFVSFLIIIAVMIPALILALVLSMGLIRAGVEGNVMGIFGFPALLAVIAVPFFVYLTLRYFIFIPLLAIDGVKGIKNIFRRNEALTQGVKWRLVGLGLIWVLPSLFSPSEGFNLVAFVLYLLLALVVTPTYLFAISDVYLKLKKRAETPALAPTPPPQPIE